MTLDDGLAIYQGRGKTPKEAFLDMFDALMYHNGLYCHKLADGSWFVGLNVLNGTNDTIEKWEKHIEEVYGKEE